MNFLKTIGLIVGIPIALLVLAFCYYRVFHSFTYRYRITVEVEADGKMHSGAGIFETTWQYSPRWLLGKDDWALRVPGTTGEAPVVDIGSHGILIAAYAPLRGYDKCNAKPAALGDAPVFAVSKTEPGGRSPMYSTKKEKLFAALEAFHDTYQLPPYELPQLIWLPDRNDRLSAQIVCPENLSATIDSSIRLNSVSVGMTRDYPDDAIYEKIPWLKARVQDEQSHVVNTSIDPQKFELMSFYLLGDR